MQTSVSREAEARPGAAKASRGSQWGKAVAAPRAPRKPRRVSLDMTFLSGRSAPLEVRRAEDQGDQPGGLLVLVPGGDPRAAGPPLGHVVDQQGAIGPVERPLEEARRHGVDETRRGP